MLAWTASRDANLGRMFAWTASQDATPDGMFAWTTGYMGSALTYVYMADNERHARKPFHSW
jgi:hypothetical protein